jgi:hypothetical protein
MAKNNQPARWEATLLAAIMALAGVPFLFDRLGPLMRVTFFSLPAVSHSAPVLLVAVGAILLLAEQGTTGTDSSNRGQSERRQHDL